ncbi:glycosyltransferase family protein [Ferdinandcohnia quinoae]|uniref:Glycosyl transferase family 1 n=1 Tax=Fredinandcohnia quinoae TaxID=2918902 RepID=A0AAW5E049_9BACI|nr:glycosyl transferase family 1 [Fredinandcohnia sp. SECRCQ15]MCH1626282.1 glycosyl transferase family 1 [Fredinandcohnia sp. SECRCQ15]
MSVKVCMLSKFNTIFDSRMFKNEAKSLLKNGFNVTSINPRYGGYLCNLDFTTIRDKFLEKFFIYEGIQVLTYEYYQEPLDTMLTNIKRRTHHAFNDPLMEAGLTVDAEIYHAHSIYSLYAGIGIKRAMKESGKEIKLIYDCRDMNVDPLNNRPDKHKLMELLLHMLDEVDYLLTVSQSIKAWYLSLKPNLPIELIYNSPPLVRMEEEKIFNEAGLTACYEGIVHSQRGGLEKILRITELMNDQILFQFMILGGLTRGHRIVVPEKFKEQVTHHNWVDYHSIPDYMKDVDIGWIDLDMRFSLNRMFAMPNKFFSALNNGVPVVCNKGNDMENFIRFHHCGLVIDKYSPSAEDYADAFIYLDQHRDELKTMSKNARYAMESHYSWEFMEKRLVDVYHRLIEKDRERVYFLT